MPATPMNPGKAPIANPSSNPIFSKRIGSAAAAALAILLWVLPGSSRAASQDASHPRVLASASEPAYPPFAIVRKDGSADGFSVELLRAVALAEGYEITFRVGPWNAIRQDLIAGRLDVLPLVAYSTERDAVFDFTAPYLHMHGTLFVRTGETAIRTETDLRDRELIVMRGDAAHEYAVKQRLTRHLVLTDTYQTALKLLSEGRHDAVLMQKLVGLQLIRDLGITNLIPLDARDPSPHKPTTASVSGFEQKLCIAVKEGDKALLSRLNEGLSITVANGVYQHLYDKWFAPILPKPAVSPLLILRYLLYLLVPLLCLIGILGIWYLRRQVAEKTRALREQLALNNAVMASLSASQRRLSMAVTATADAVWEWDLSTHRTYFSPKWYEMLGYENEEISMDLQGWQQLCHPEDLRPTLDLIHSRIASQNDVGYAAEFRMRKKDGSWLWILGRGRVVERDSAGKPVLLSGTNTNITAQKQAEATLHRLAQFPEENPNPVMRIGADGALLYRNAAARNWLASHNHREQAFLPPPLEAAIIQARETREVVKAETTTPDGRTFSFSAINPAGEVYVNLYGMEMTEQKQAEEALRAGEERIRASLAEKEVLLKEVHHRVKNNLQVISSLVSLQAEEVMDPVLRGTLLDLTHRVRTMAMVHEKLYQAGDLAHVDFSDYIESLLTYLWRAHQHTISGIRLKTDLAPIRLPVNAAVPCGLILNELVANALKHAFDGRTEGCVAVSLKRDEAGPVHLEVSDDGRGLPVNLDWQAAGSLGLRLVRMLTRQLDAAVTVERDPGTRFTISFHPPEMPAGKTAPAAAFGNARPGPAAGTAATEKGLS